MKNDDTLRAMIESYKNEVEDNERLKEWIDKLTEFLMIHYYMTTYVDEIQWNNKKKEIVRKICVGKCE